MPKSGLNVALKGSMTCSVRPRRSRQEEQREQVQQIPVSDELFPFKDHPFKVLDDDA